MGFFDGLATGLLGGVGGLITNFMSGERQKETEKFNAEQAQINRDFQERMSNTAYQRSMEDMREAGLNPILAYQKGGASSPTGSMAQSVSPAPVTDVVGTGISSANAKTRLDAELDNLRSTNENLKRTNDLIHAQTAREFSQTTLNENQAKLSELNSEKVAADTAISKANLSSAEKQAMEAELEKQNLNSFLGRWNYRIGAGVRQSALSPAVNTAKSLSRFGR